MVRAENEYGYAPYSPELTVNLCGPNCHHSFQSSVPVAPIFQAGKEHEHTDDHDHPEGVTVVPVAGTDEPLTNPDTTKE